MARKPDIKVVANGNAVIEAFVKLLAQAGTSKNATVFNKVYLGKLLGIDPRYVSRLLRGEPITRTIAMTLLTRLESVFGPLTVTTLDITFDSLFVEIGSTRDAADEGGSTPNSPARIARLRVVEGGRGAAAPADGDIGLPALPDDPIELTGICHTVADSAGKKCGVSRTIAWSVTTPWDDVFVVAATAALPGCDCDWFNHSIASHFVPQAVRDQVGWPHASPWLQCETSFRLRREFCCRHLIVPRQLGSDHWVLTRRGNTLLEALSLRG
jgi:hypothetical protein